MSIILTVNGNNWSYPTTGDTGWGGNATGWANAITYGTLQKSGGTFQLLADVNFGTDYGLISNYFTSTSANAASSGILNLANTDVIAWRNYADNADLTLSINSSDQLVFSGGFYIPTISIADLTVTDNLDLSYLSTGVLHSDSDGNVTSSLIVTADITDNNVTLAKLPTQANHTVLANISGGSAVPSAITLGSTLIASGGNIVTTALSGDVTSSSNSFATTIASNAVTYDKMQQAGASVLLGNPTGSTATISEITLGAGLEFSGSTLVALGAVTSVSNSDGTVTVSPTTGDVVISITDTNASAILDTIDNTQGDILYRNSSGWTALAPGTSGYVLSTQGPSANPQWVAQAAGSGTVTSVATDSTLTGGPITTTGTLGIDLTNANTWTGQQTFVAPILGTPASGDFSSGTFTWPTFNQNTTGSAGSAPYSTLSGTAAQGDILYYTGSAWDVLAPGTSGYLLQTNGAAANPSWVTAPATGVTSVATNNGLTGGTITSTGTLGLAAIADGDLLANTSGGSLYPSATTLTGLIDYNLGSTQGDILYRNGTVWTVLGPGTSGQILATQGAAANPHWINNTGGVTSLTGDGTIISNSSSTGAVTLTLETVANNYFLAGPTSGGPLAPTYRAIVAGDVPTLNQNTNGTAANVTGTVAIANGGTGQTTANAALNALLPSQTGNTNYYLQTDGTNTSWVAQSGGGVSASTVWAAVGYASCGGF